MTVGVAGIETISGALKRPKKQDGHNHGNYLTNPNCQRVYAFGAERYKRTTPLSTDETRIRNRFSAVAAAVAARAKDLMKISADQAAFAAQKDQPGGKKTMKAYLWSLEKAAYDAEHQG